MSNQYYSPHQQHQQRFYPAGAQQQPSTSSSHPGGPMMEPQFTPAMRDRQARGKDPYSPSDMGMESPPRAPGKVGSLGGGDDGDTFEDRRQKLFAIEILDDPEKLAMYACSRGDSIPGTRLHFTRILCGLDTNTPPPQQQHDPRKASASRRDPRRRSAGGDRLDWVSIDNKNMNVISHVLLAGPKG
ncbi:hypothetical protein CGCSCA1_v003678 [Colletotrichum siamense]|nr:hypothetical protein CGCSCA1_v003678 [Colletotrichum siamense]